MQGGTRIGLVPIAVVALLAAAPVAQADTNLGTVAGLTYMRDAANTAPAPSELIAYADCPAATHAVGGGLTWLSASNVPPVQFWVNRTRPFDGPDADHSPDDGWLGRGYNRFGSDKSLFVFAVCYAGTVRYATNHASGAAGSAIATRAACPAGTHVAGGGAGLGGVPVDEAYLTTSQPYDSGDADHRPDDGWRARGYNQGGATKALTVYAACVEFPSRYASTTSSDPAEQVGATCPAGTHTTGGGGTIAAPALGSWLSSAWTSEETGDPPDNTFWVTAHRADTSASYTANIVCKA